MGFLLVLVLGRFAWFPWMKGSPTSTRLFGLVPFLDPLSGMEVLLASRSAPWTLILGVTATASVAAVFGRVFCGWLCPLGLLSDLNDGLRWRLRRLLSRLQIRLPEITIPRQTKYGVLLFCLIVSGIGSVPIFTTVSPINLIVLALVFSSTTGLIVVAVILMLEQFSRRAFCRCLCPAGVVYGWLSRWRRLGVRIRNDSRATPCRRCTLSCPMGIRVSENYVVPGKATVDSSECTLCGDCLDACPSGLLCMGIRRKSDDR
ncbi:MAG: 4Fe-4S binding protein [Planctomycetes bacterium]|nr:4Fe-4S binding protein [Planctomycetota bacterium]